MLSLEVIGMSVVLGWAEKLSDRMDQATRNALQAAALYWMNQHKARWIQQISPEGETWQPNVRMWTEIKGQSTPLTGITQGTTRTWQGLAFKGNTIHMRSALKKKTTGDSIIFYYPETVKERARITQEGGEGVLVGIRGGKEVIFNFKIPARPHTGIGPDDLDQIERIFSVEVDRALL